MYKLQMKIQRILCVLAIITSALVFAYSLGILTDLYDMLYQITDSRAGIDYSLYYDMQRFVQSAENWLQFCRVARKRTTFCLFSLIVKDVFHHDRSRCRTPIGRARKVFNTKGAEL